MKDSLLYYRDRLAFLSKSVKQRIEEKKMEICAKKMGVLVGIPLSPGVAVGRVRIIQSESELYELQPGEIAVFPYYPLIPGDAIIFFGRRAGAIVIDRRVPKIGHLAIVLMEFQTPAVMGTRIATKVLENGKRIKVDATNGVVVFRSPGI